MSNLNFYISRAQGHNQAISVNHFINENFSKYLSKIVEVLNEDITYKINQDNSIERAQDAWDAQVTDLKVTNHTIETFFNKLKKYHEIEEGKIVLFNNNQTQFNLENFIKFLKSETGKKINKDSDISEISNMSTSFEFKITTDPMSVDLIVARFNAILKKIYDRINENTNFMEEEKFKDFVAKINEKVTNKFKFELIDNKNNKKKIDKQIIDEKRNTNTIITDFCKVLINSNDSYIEEIIDKIKKLGISSILEGNIKDLNKSIIRAKSKVNIQYFPNPLTGVTGTIAGS
jgi:ATP phosphoribosyltransferase